MKSAHALIAVAASLSLLALGCEKKPADAPSYPSTATRTAPTSPGVADPALVDKTGKPSGAKEAAEPALPTAKTEELAVDTAVDMDEVRQQTERAAALMKGLGDSKVEGTVSFAVDKDDDGVEVQVKLSGLSPGEHGFHIHMNGDCSAADGSSAGGHFNPTKAEHGAPDAASHHVGDLGNIKADEDGKVDTTVTLRGATIAQAPMTPGDHSIIGRAVIVHGGADDMKSQPSGDAGAPVACGVITKVEF
ncbi:MAG: superoxide dismutase family protein [Myxococcota bacterium]